MDLTGRPSLWKRRGRLCALGLAGVALLIGGWVAPGSRYNVFSYTIRNAVREEMWSVGNYDGLIIAQRFVIRPSTRATGFEFLTGSASDMDVCPYQFTFSREVGEPPLNLYYTLRCPIWLLIPPWIGVCLMAMAWRDRREATHPARLSARTPSE